MKQFLKNAALAIFSLTTVSIATAQSPLGTLEMTVGNFAVPTVGAGTGPSTNTITATLKSDALNGNTAANNTVMNTSIPPFTVSVSFANQQYTGLNYGGNYTIGATTFNNAQSTGLIFGGSPTLAEDANIPANVGGATRIPRYATIGSYTGAGGPTADMFTSDPNPGGTAPAGSGFLLAGGDNELINAGVSVFTTAQVLYGTTGINSRVYFGDLVLTFNRPVENPVIHFAGLGGSYRYFPIGSATRVGTFFSTELDLATPGVTSTRLSGNTNFVVSGNNILNGENARPDGGSAFVAGQDPNLFGAATGSVRINGTVQQLVYRVYLEGGSASDFAWSAPKAAIQNALKDPFTGDVWYVAVSSARPVPEQISGNIYNDADGIIPSNNDVHTTGAVANPRTNAGGPLYANLVNANTNLVIKNDPIGGSGSFLFEGVTAGLNYYVSISTTPGVPNQAPPAASLPSGWVNTGEFIGAGAGNDGTVNGISSTFTVLAGTAVDNIDFGIERLPESITYSTQITKPALNSTKTLNGVLPILSGSDPEDMPVTNVLTGKTVQITTLANGIHPTTLAVIPNAQLKYNNVVVVVNQIIPNFNPALLTVTFNVAVAGDFTQFQYAYVDAAGKPDPTPANYRLNWIAGGTLAVDLGDFSVRSTNCSAILNWHTVTETSADKFEIEMSTGGDFEKVGEVKATGTSSTRRDYSFAYNMKPGVKYQFRIQSVSMGGNKIPSAIGRASCSGSKMEIVLSPNPVRDGFRIAGLNNGKNIVTIFSADGKAMIKGTLTGTTDWMNVSTLGAGTYVVRVQDEQNTVSTIQFVKL